MARRALVHGVCGQSEFVADFVHVNLLEDGRLDDGEALRRASIVSIT
ncbi:MAG TPA: hypothetical protein VLL25_04160 [Acidimicrobiales bacterium]|nr:hypothetical protein [Acidimicrobiales bacterium]